MSENDYQLVAWTENGEVRFSGVAMWEQEMLLREEIYAVDPDSRDWECYSRLTYLYWQRGMLLLELKEPWGAYDCFVDGLYVCLEAIRNLHFPKSGGINPFLLAMDDLLDGCHKAALEDDSLEEVYYESAFHEIRMELWEETRKNVIRGILEMIGSLTAD